MEDKNQINLSGIESSGNALAYTPPTVITVKGPVSNPFTPSVPSIFTVPIGCTYLEGLLVAGGGAGGRENYQPSLLTFASGGGGSGAWCRFRLTQADFTSGSTIFQLTVGCGASNNAIWTMAKGADTEFSLFGGSTLIRVIGGDSGANDVFDGTGGNGGILDPAYTNYVTTYGNGQTGITAKHFSPTIFATTAVWTGTGGWSPFGSPGKGPFYGALQSTNGASASGFGAGGGGCANAQFLNANFYGGTGAPGYARIVFYYQ